MYNTVRRVQPNALRLMTSNSEDINQASWLKYRTTITTGRTDPQGGTASEAAFETAVSNTHGFGLEPAPHTLSLGRRYRVSAIVKPIGDRNLQIAFYNNAFIFVYKQNYDLQTGVLGSAPTTDNIIQQVKSSIRAIPGGYFQIDMSFKSTELVNPNFYFGILNSTFTESYLGDVTKGLDVYKAGLYSE